MSRFKIQRALFWHRKHTLTLPKNREFNKNKVGLLILSLSLTQVVMFLRVGHCPWSLPFPWLWLDSNNRSMSSQTPTCNQHWYIIKYYNGNDKLPLISLISVPLNINININICIKDNELACLELLRTCRVRRTWHLCLLQWMIIIRVHIQTTVDILTCSDIHWSYVTMNMKILGFNPQCPQPAGEHLGTRYCVWLCWQIPLLCLWLHLVFVSCVCCLNGNN